LSTPIAAPRRALWFFSFAALVVLVDQISKSLVLANLQPGRYYDVLGPVLRWYLVRNDSAAFSLGGGVTWAFTLFSAVAAVAVIWASRKVSTASWAIMAGALLGGILGNLIDRVSREPGFPNGHVVDFISLPFNFAIFNLADSAIVVVAIISVIRVMRGERILK
jgi:signal peptidase II